MIYKIWEMISGVKRMAIPHPLINKGQARTLRRQQAQESFFLKEQLHASTNSACNCCIFKDYL